MGIIEIQTKSQEDEVLLPVMDNGIRIPKEDLKKAFEHFFSTGGVQRTEMGLARSYGTVKQPAGASQLKADGARERFLL